MSSPFLYPDEAYLRNSPTQESKHIINIKPTTPETTTNESERQKYWPLYRAIVTGDWKEAEEISKKDENAIIGCITFHKETVFHVVFGTGMASYLVKKLVDMTFDELVLIQTKDDCVSPIHLAAMKGNTEAAKMEGLLPIHFAAESGHRETLAYFILNTPNHDDDDDYIDVYSGQSGLKLLLYTIDAGLYVSGADQTHNKDMIREGALQLVKCLCKNIQDIDHDLEAQTICYDALMEAIRYGNSDAVQIILEAFPDTIITTIWKREEFLFGVAAVNRCEIVFLLIHRAIILGQRQSFEIFGYRRNNILHHTARLAPSDKLNLVPGAALQMQLEMQWYKEIEKLASPPNREELNGEYKTPWMIFTEEHEKLKSDGEKWMKQTANSCSIVAALIATVVFAAAITVPGGNKQELGLPFFSGETAFLVFAIFDAISFFASILSLLMFLAIITSRFAEEDFLYALPNRLIICLLSVYTSILFMMVAFGATLYIVFGKKHRLIIIPVCLLSCFPIASLAYLQASLLFDVISHTYGAGNLGKRIKRLKIGEMDPLL
ncbi:hypothetical protein ACS0TY_016437 [Phlomoides rotata]